MSSYTFIHLFHIIFVGGLFLYVGIRRTEIAKWMYPFLLGLGIIVTLYHTFKVYSNIKNKKPYWFNLIHIFLVGPLLVYIGYNEEKTKRLYFELLLLLAFSTIGYHGYYLIDENL